MEGESTLIHLTLRKPEIGTGCMGHLARKGFILALFTFAAYFCF